MALLFQGHLLKCHSEQPAEDFLPGSVLLLKLPLLVKKKNFFLHVAN
jgi:hypothetical protein